MGTPWDAAAPGYLEQWVPRFLPYHADLVRELSLRPGDRVLIPSAGPGAEVLHVARVVGASGFVRATDRSEVMVALCREQVERAQVPARIECELADATRAFGGPWDAVVCAFGLWQLPSKEDAMRAWAGELSPGGKVGIITWGPFEADGPFERLRSALHDVAPDYPRPHPHLETDRDAMCSLFRRAGLDMVRHTVVRHTLSFKSAEAFVRAMRDGCTWRRVWEELGEDAFQRVAARFFDSLGGPHGPLAFDPPATLAIGTLARAT
ncbi:MAG: methyltransferase domain-containing protein [Polyangiaceae bacterium]